MTERNRIPVLEKAVELLEYIGAAPGKVTQGELIAALGIPQATCYRIVATLVDAGWLRKCGDGRYDLGSRLPEVARKAAFDLARYRLLQPILDHLVRRVGFTAKLSVRDGEEQVNVLSAKAPWDIAITTVVGAREPLLTGGSVGTVLLAALPAAELQAIPGARNARGLAARLRQCRKLGYALHAAAADPAPRWKVDALSIPVVGSGATAALTILALPGELAATDLAALLAELHKTAEFCADNLP